MASTTTHCGRRISIFRHRFFLCKSRFWHAIVLLVWFVKLFFLLKFLCFSINKLKEVSSFRVLWKQFLRITIIEFIFMKRCHFYFIGILPLLSFILLLLQLNSNRPRMGVRLSVGVVIGLGMGSLKTIRIGPELETVFMHLRLPRTTSRVLGLT